MNCSKILDMIYEEDNKPITSQIQVWLHVFFCPECAAEIERYQNARAALREDFFPPSPGIEDSIMAKLSHDAETEEPAAIGGFSTRGWVIAGLILMISLITSFFGLEFRNLASESGMSFMLPMGITIVLVLTTYGALFIGSHLKELSERFGL